MKGSPGKPVRELVEQCPCTGGLRMELKAIGAVCGDPYPVKKGAGWDERC